jgi:hypothetical protein
VHYKKNLSKKGNFSMKIFERKSKNLNSFWQIKNFHFQTNFPDEKIKIPLNPHKKSSQEKPMKFIRSLSSSPKKLIFLAIKISKQNFFHNILIEDRSGDKM